MIKRIIITGDTRRSTTNQIGNITRFYWSLKAQLEKVIDVVPELYVTEDRLPDDKWVELYKPNKDHVPWITTQTDITDDVLVLSWELPYNDIEWFNEHSIKYIDFITYPICMFGGLGHSNPVYGVSVSKSFMFFDNMLSEYHTQIQANKLRAMYASKDRISIPENTALIVGQTPIDRSLISDTGKIITLYDYEKEIKNIVQSHPMTIFRPHPNAWARSKNKEDIPKYMESLGCKLWDDIKIHQPQTQDPWTIYDILSEPKIKTVAGISSSCIYEAIFFEKSTIRFDNRYSKFVFGKYIPVKWHDIQKAKWWGKTLEGEL